MTDRELRRLGRGDLIEILYQYQRREQQLEEQNAERAAPPAGGTQHTD